MQEVKKAINAAAGGERVEFIIPAIDWATYCLKNHYGNLLTAGLRLSQALVEYQRLRDEPDKCTELY